MTDPNGSQSTALVLPEDIMADLLKAQAGSITTQQQLPEIGIMGAGVGLYEFGDQPGKTAQTFRGIVLNNHPKNILWDKPMGQGLGPNGEKAKPACSSNNGVVGIVREGFAHKGLPDGEVGDGNKTVTCATCPYNEFGTGNMFNPTRNPKGKATANQRAVYLMMEGVALPYRLILSPMSVPSFDEYMMALVARRIPIQAVITEFSQTIETKSGQKYGVARFAMVGNLNNDQFSEVMSMRKQWEKSISASPVVEPALQATATVDDAHEPVAAATSGSFDDFPAVLEDKDDNLPF